MTTNQRITDKNLLFDRKIIKGGKDRVREQAKGKGTKGAFREKGPLPRRTLQVDYRL